jgi:hypothetical protein
MTSNKISMLILILAVFAYSILALATYQTEKTNNYNQPSITSGVNSRINYAK